MADLSKVPSNAFISYSHKDTHIAADVKRLLAEIGVYAFLAHEDLQVSDEWRERIIRELRVCELFVPLLSRAFIASRWGPQEVGFIVSRPEVLIAPLSLDGTRSFGFISHLQSPRISSEGVTHDVLVAPLARRFPRQILPALIRKAASARSFRAAEEAIRPLVPLFPLLTFAEAQTFATAAVENNQIWPAHLCRTEFLPNFLGVQGANIEPSTRRALEYQIKHQQWYNGTS